MSEESSQEFVDSRKNNKRKHITLTIEQKLRIIALVEDGNSSRQMIATQFGIGKSTVHDIHKQRDKIREFAMIKSPDDISKRRRVDTSTRSELLDVKQEDEMGEEEMTDSIEGFDYQEINEHDYEIVYESGYSLPNITAEVDDKHVKNNFVPAKRKSRTLTFREKYEVIMQIESGTQVPLVCEQFGIGRTTVYDIMRRKQEIIDFVETSNDVERRTFKKTKFPEVEELVVNWCESRESFTKQQFNEHARVTFEDFKYNENASVPSGFCGSWSWSKRFFNRHPHLKQKLTDAGPADPIRAYVEGTLVIDKQSTKADSAVHNKLAKSLTNSEKLQILDEIDAGKAVADIADVYEVHKSTIYEIFKQRNDIRRANLDNPNRLKRTTRQPKYPKLELELLRWCLKQKNVPLSNVLIADKALSLFDSLDLKGNFNPSYAWAKKFVLRHPELYEKQGIVFINELPDIQQDRLIDSIEEMDERQDSDTAESFDLEEPYIFPHDYEEEYIVEELEPQLDEDRNDEMTEDESAEPKDISRKRAGDTKKEDLVDELEIADDVALKSLETLMKYSEQRGHSDFLSQLIDYQNQLLNDVQ